ncbi:MAG: hypothetical protein KDD67_03130 [Ignavibacteriae bacterium]|nr:hypothetical protein [Ignavibacteriota bacterium]
MTRRCAVRGGLPRAIDPGGWQKRREHRKIPDGCTVSFKAPMQHLTID